MFKLKLIIIVLLLAFNQYTTLSLAAHTTKQLIIISKFNVLIDIFFIPTTEVPMLGGRLLKPRRNIIT